ncbi:SAM-dependent methyltransferase [Amycolatopsis sp. cg5]|uniref:SAM-dependent methyltransferase n=1 Tax=Amycolatopsis sp. cg5 TaxID=3238802 RepID=UPI00352443C8
MALPVAAADGHAPEHPSIARINDCWLEGGHHADGDVLFANHIAVCAPHVPYLVREERALLARMVRYLIGHGVRQFVDLGSGVPASGHVHEIAHELAPSTRVVYVDSDPGVAAEGREMLAGNDNAAYLRADIRRPEAVFGATEFRQLIDLTEPVAVLMIEMLINFPDSENPRGLVSTYLEPLCPGSYLGLSHFGDHEELDKGLNMFSRMFGQPPAVTLRDREQFAKFFTGLEIIEPGVVPVPLWRPLEDEVGHNPDHAHVHAGLGRKRVMRSVG